MQVPETKGKSAAELREEFEGKGWITGGIGRRRR